MIEWAIEAGIIYSFGHFSGDIAGKTEVSRVAELREVQTLMERKFAGFDDVLLKPLRQSHLVSRLKQVASKSTNRQDVSL
jgi:hypothetical protein